MSKFWKWEFRGVRFSQRVFILHNFHVILYISNETVGENRLRM